ncbi:hypothetical protein Nepgr_015733 [Nepenthes gracilis]|uniref:Uncharacterized protein n=1 Tax=Nepenthes gracilis TaxID=150966 RepID=A0AAD3SNS7_NEPGR|nr:hypothetical protein Nepgr_015733 [Nepenthes gracilis]
MDVLESAGIVGASEAEQTSEFIEAFEMGGLKQEPESVEVPEVAGSPAGALPGLPPQDLVAFEDVASECSSVLGEPRSILLVEESSERSKPPSNEEVAEPAEPPSAPASGVASHGIGSSFAQALEVVHSIQAVSSHLDELLSSDSRGSRTGG